MVLVVGVTVSLPEADFVPDQPFEAVHEVGLLVEDHVKVALCPDAIEVGEAESVTTGADVVVGGGGGGGVVPAALRTMESM